MNPILQLLLNPAIISLLAGLTVGSLFKIKLPENLTNLVALYLVFTIGYKGGMCFSQANSCTDSLLTLTLIAICIGFLQPIIHWFVLKKTTLLDLETRAVVATEYGSISIVTFITTITFLTERAIGYDSYMSALAGIMEIPAILSGLWLIKHYQTKKKQPLIQSLFSISIAIIQCKKISFIFLGFFVGYIVKYSTAAHLMNEVTLKPFNLMLVLFMVDIGIKISKQIHQLHEFSWSLIAFGIYMPIINGTFGLIIGSFFTSSLGTLILFGILLSSASYIAVPAIMSSQAPRAKEAIYLPLALGITLPFNIILGIPLYYYIAQFVLSYS